MPQDALHRSVATVASLHGRSVIGVIQGAQPAPSSKKRCTILWSVLVGSRLAVSKGMVPPRTDDRITSYPEQVAGHRAGFNARPWAHSVQESFS